MGLTAKQEMTKSTKTSQNNLPLTYVTHVFAMLTTKWQGTTELIHKNPFLKVKISL